MTRDDADDPALNDMMTRRLTREIEKLKAGDEVELRVASGGSTKSVRVKTVAAHDLETAMAPLKSTMNRSFAWSANEDRAAVGIGLGGSSSKRDTLGVFVVSVSPDGPAEKAGIVEGDRIAKINGTDVRVQAPEAGENDMSRAMISRFNRELGKLKAGDAATLTVVSGGRSREVKVTTVKPSEVHGSDGFFFGNGTFIMPRMENMPDFNWDTFPQMKTIPPGAVRTFKFPDGAGRQIYQFNDSDEIRAGVKEKIEKAMEKARESIEKARVISADKKAMVIREPVKIKPAVKVIRIAT
jgi:membrane-associated protease RseP (regulator of RpoE activity)